MICKINRILITNSGNALLIGLEGNGVKSLTKLASFMQSNYFMN
jgi:hypothetical protein